MRTKIDYGIDLGTTNSAIARMENGKPKVIQTDVQKDTLPSCVAINPRKNIIVGDAANAASIKDKLRATENFGNESTNSYLEFKRTMGTGVKYHSSILSKEFTSEELSGEVLKKLKSFVTDEQIKSIVITVPAKFTLSQNEATINAAKMAGFEVVELLQEPIAASIAYGLETKEKDGQWLVFDFGGGTFDVALVRLEEGIMKIIDTEGNNQLGGKDLDLAIVDKLIIPHLKENFSIVEILSDGKKNEAIRNAMKSFAERVKIDLSFNNLTDITTLPGEIRTKDENGDEFELSLDISQDDLIPVFEPIFQKSIDITKHLLAKNNLKGSDIDCLILVGGPTYSPILQRMLREQITQKVIAKNQMTSVAIGAALYASTKDIGVTAPPPPKGTIALELKYDSTSVESDSLINLKINPKDTSFDYPEKVYATIERGDKSYSSTKVLIGDKKAVLIEVLLNKSEANYFSIILTDEKGDRIPCEPNNFTITDIHIPSAPLPYHIGIEVWNEKRKVKVFKPLKGLEKNQILKNAVGIITGIKTPKQLTPGIEDSLIIPIYQGNDGAEYQNSFHSNHVTDVVITTDKLPRVVPVNSDLEITLTFNESGGLPVCSVFIPIIDYTEEIPIELKNEPIVDSVWLKNELNKDMQRTQILLEADSDEDLHSSSKDLIALKTEFDNEQGSEEGKIKILNNLRKIRLVLDKHEAAKEWPNLKIEIKESYYKAEELVELIKGDDELVEKFDISKVDARLADFKTKLEQIIKLEDVELAKETTEDIDDFIRAIIDIIQPGTREKAYIEYITENFGSITWINATKAKEFVNKAIFNINNNGDIKQLNVFCHQINDLIDRSVNQPNIPILDPTKP
jgi:molecular chaperone DnaK